MHILITNDDGVRAPGLQQLKIQLQQYGYQISVVAPNGQRSASSHAMTIGKPLYCRQWGQGDIAVSGTPVDCVKLAMEKFLVHQRPQLIISGINDGFNLGSDVLYSGTVSAAMEGPYYQVPAIAVSMEKWDEMRGKKVISVLHEVIQRLIIGGKFPGILNINIPSKGEISWDRIRLATQAVQLYDNVILEKKDQDNSRYYIIEGEADLQTAMVGTDIDMIRSGFISLTPLQWQQMATGSFLTIKEELQKKTCNL
ncbi:5'/3'-nucleotidase SurE [uncultured Megasphaera sp.]|uniref:5'/3'-nucleotidase SurE n=1 Tax=uncultured Megasphaera sp. TaxID=165188 RepID=UPI0025919AC9|nr:5'/3'-nucleotidase SurE [uncultured Megasphaera sp.]